VPAEHARRRPRAWTHDDPRAARFQGRPRLEELLVPKLLRRDDRQDRPSFQIPFLAIARTPLLS